MNHESRLRALEKEVKELKEIIGLFKQKNKWVTLTEASKQLDTTPTVIRNRILKGVLVHGKDWKRHGNRYLVNLINVRKIS